MITCLVHRKGFRQLFDAAADAMVAVDTQGNVVAANPEAERLFGDDSRSHRVAAGSADLFREKEQAFVTLASIADGIVTTDLAGTVTYLNPMAERLTGWRTSEALGQPLGTVLPLISESTRQFIENILACCLKEGRTVDLADGVVLQRRDGTEVVIGDSAAPIRDRNGATTGAVEEGSFQLFAQAIVPLAPASPSRPRCEILLRLPDERGGVESPSAFLPQAERYSLMPLIDRWVVRQTVVLLAGWHRKHPECELPLCAINLNASSLEDAELVSAVLECLAEHQLPPETLCFEISEVAAIGNFAQLVDYVKIGGHYVRGVVEAPVYGTRVGAVNRIGRIIGITTIAQEVESEPVLERLRVLGVEYAQGHAVALPAPLVDADGDVALPCIQRSA